MIEIEKLKKRLHWENLVEKIHCDEWGKYRIFSLAPSNPEWYPLDFVFDEECSCLQSLHFGTYHAHYDSYECEKCNINLAIMAVDRLISQDLCLLEELDSNDSYLGGCLVGANDIDDTLSKDVMKFRRIFFNREPVVEDIDYDKYLEEEYIFIEKRLHESNNKIRIITSNWSTACKEQAPDTALSKIPVMDEDLFWQTIEKIQLLDKPDNVNRLLLEIHDWSPEKIISFQMCFNEMMKKSYNWNLWGAYELMECGEIYQEDFNNFLQGIIARGKDVFCRAIENADSLAGLNLSQLLSYTDIDGIIEMEYESKAGGKMPRDLAFQDHDPTGVKWNFKSKKERQKHLPQLYEKYASIFEEN